MLVRLIALLLSLGMMMFISTQAQDAGSAPAEAAALVDLTDDVPFDLVEPTVLPAPDARVAEPATVASQPSGHRHEMSVFRPPRAALA